MSNSRRVKTVQELLDALCDLYSLLKEEDLFVGLWQKRSKYNETNIALAYEQHGFFENAQLTFEQVKFFLIDCVLKFPAATFRQIVVYYLTVSTYKEDNFPLSAMNLL